MGEVSRLRSLEKRRGGGGGVGEGEQSQGNDNFEALSEQLQTVSGVWTAPDDIRTAPDGSGRLQTVPDGSR